MHFLDAQGSDRFSCCGVFHRGEYERGANRFRIQFIHVLSILVALFSATADDIDIDIKWQSYAASARGATELVPQTFAAGTH